MNIHVKILHGHFWVLRSSFFLLKDFFFLFPFTSLKMIFPVCRDSELRNMDMEGTGAEMK